jgi:hypothetical protein
LKPDEGATEHFLNKKIPTMAHIMAAPPMSNPMVNACGLPPPSWFGGLLVGVGVLEVLGRALVELVSIVVLVGSGEVEVVGLAEVVVGGGGGAEVVDGLGLEVVVAGGGLVVVP